MFLGIIAQECTCVKSAAATSAPKELFNLRGKKIHPEKFKMSCACLKFNKKMLANNEDDVELLVLDKYLATERNSGLECFDEVYFNINTMTAEGVAVSNKRRELILNSKDPFDFKVGINSSIKKHLTAEYVNNSNVEEDDPHECLLKGNYLSDYGSKHLASNLNFDKPLQQRYTKQLKSA